MDFDGRCARCCPNQTARGRPARNRPGGKKAMPFIWSFLGLRMCCGQDGRVPGF